MKFAKIGGVLALLLVQWGSSAPVAYRTNRTIDRNLNPASATPWGSGPNSHWILQFKDSPGADVRGELARRGVRVLEYVEDSALIVSFHRSPGRQSPDLTGLNITWTGQLTAADRAAPGLETAPTFLVVFHSDVPKVDAERLLEGFEVHVGPASWPVDAPHYLVAADHARLPQLAARDEVSYILPGGIRPGRMPDEDRLGVALSPWRCLLKHFVGRVGKPAADC
jgi:hypothetical protein